MASPYNPEIPTAEEEEVVTKTLQLFWQLHSVRATFASHWEEVAELVLPEYRNTFQYGTFNWPGQKKTSAQVDATGMMALQRFSAIVDSLLTPANSRWHALGTNNPILAKNRNVKLWFEMVTDILFHQRYTPSANFVASSHQNYLSLGGFGTMAMLVDELEDPIYKTRGLRYIAVPLGELYLYCNAQGQVIGFIRYFKMTARQAMLKFGEKRFPEALRAPLEQNSEVLFDFLHHVGIRENYQPQRLDYKGKPYTSDYISMSGNCLVQQGGYRSFPLATGRYTQAPGETYGRSPAMQVLPALKTLNLQKRTALKVGHRISDPVLLTADDGLVSSVDLRPGAINPGGVTSDGRPLVLPLPIGNYQVAVEQMQDERTLINDSFLITLFQILTETPQMTATEVIQRTAEKSILLAPSIGRQQGEYLGSMIERELDVLAYLKLLPPMPQELIDAKGEYEVVYTSPLSKSMRAQEAAGFMRTVENALQIVQATQDMSIMDNFNFDEALPQIAEIQGVQESWMADPKMIQRKRQARAQQMQRQQAIQAAPAQAAMMKARLEAQQAQQAQQQPPGQQVNQPGTGLAALQIAPQGRPQF